MPNKIIPTQEMIEDLSKMGDADYCKKWGVSRRMPIKFRKEFSIKSFTPQHGIKRMIIDGSEYKWCPRGGGHWELLSNFCVCKSRAGGYRGFCKKHDRQYAKEIYYSTNQIENSRAWKKTENGQKYLRRTWRRERAKKDNAYVKWEREDEERAYSIFEGKCGYCGHKIPFLEIEFDHYIPISLGGKTEPKNMVPCCSICNHGVGGKFNREPEEWIMWRFPPEYAKDIIFDVARKLQIIYELGLGSKKSRPNL